MARVYNFYPRITRFTPKISCNKSNPKNSRQFACFASLLGKVKANDCQAWKNIDATFGSGLYGAMKTKLLFMSGCIALLSLAFVCLSSAADTKSAIEQALRDLDEQWSEAAGAKDVDKTVSFYSDDAIVMPPNAASATTKEAIRALWKDLLTDAKISWKTKKVEVAQSGDLAFSSGTYEVTLNDPTGKSVNDRGKYVVVWEKQADGTWKCAADIWNSDLPATAPTAPEKK
jgi:ketosteroid isomerase-like protein